MGEIAVPLFSLPRRRLCRNAKSHECHSEPQAKNLTIAAPCKCEILRLPPQDDIATQSLAGERRVEQTSNFFTASHLSKRGNLYSHIIAEQDTLTSTHTPRRFYR